ncbi:MAG: hypothetical protein NZ554_07435 [Bryobacteraceae bacterium]|nr:hypothetical protein [Bryobacteraceae bacterium]
MRATWGLVAAATLWATPPLTTIEDTLYKADGTPFNGMVFIEWRGFEASDRSNIATHQVSVRIVNGLLRVRLVPTTTATPPTTYRVRYNSEGKVQFEETWAVPPSATPLRIRDVRVAGPSSPAPQQQIIEITDVAGLSAALEQRPVKATRFASSRAVFINAGGELESVAGNVNDCVRVDGTSGPCGTGGGPGASFVDGETPAGLLNGTNAVFTLANAPAPASSLQLYRNGLLLKQDLDYTLQGNLITFSGGAVPQPGDVLTASYRLPAEGSGAHALLSTAHSDTTPAAPQRGDLIVGLGTSPTTWSRLPLGPANRCLISNGQDAVWNACLFTNFPAGSVPFVDEQGNLAQNHARLYWDNRNRRLSIGNNVSMATLLIWDATPSASTTLAVRAGEGQGAAPLASWQNAYGVEVARVDAAGQFSGASFRAATSSSGAAWRDAGSANDPSSPANGDFWYNSGAEARKTVEGGQVHTLPQVLCSSTGTATSQTALVRLGSCTIPASFLKPGDRVEVRFDYAHQGSSTGFQVAVRWGATVLVARTAPAGVAQLTGRADAGVRSSGVQWSTQSWGDTLTFVAGAGVATDALNAPLTVEFLGAMAAAGSETVRLENFTVLRYPAQANP